MATLREPIKIYIVQSLACFKTPKQVVEAVKQEFNVEIPRQQVALYDPTKASGKNLSKNLRTLFEKTRREFQDNVLDIPLANKAYRLNELQDIYESWGKNKVMKAKVIRQVRDEMHNHDTQQLNNALLRLELGKKEAEEKDDNDNTVNINIVRVGRRDGH